MKLKRLFDDQFFGFTVGKAYCNDRRVIIGVLNNELSRINCYETWNFRQYFDTFRFDERLKITLNFCFWRKNAC